MVSLNVLVSNTPFHIRLMPVHTCKRLLPEPFAYEYFKIAFFQVNLNRNPASKASRGVSLTRSLAFSAACFCTKKFFDRRWKQIRLCWCCRLRIDWLRYFKLSKLKSSLKIMEFLHPTAFPLTVVTDASHAFCEGVGSSIPLSFLRQRDALNSHFWANLSIRTWHFVSEMWSSACVFLFCDSRSLKLSPLFDTIRLLAPIKNKAWTDISQSEKYISSWHNWLTTPWRVFPVRLPWTLEFLLLSRNFVRSPMRNVIIVSQHGVRILKNQLSCTMSRQRRFDELWIIYDVNFHIIMNIQASLMMTSKSFSNWNGITGGASFTED